MLSPINELVNNVQGANWWGIMANLPAKRNWYRYRRRTGVISMRRLSSLNLSKLNWTWRLQTADQQSPRNAFWRFCTWVKLGNDIILPKSKLVDARLDSLRIWNLRRTSTKSTKCQLPNFPPQHLPDKSWHSIPYLKRGSDWFLRKLFVYLRHCKASFVHCLLRKAITKRHIQTVQKLLILNFLWLLPPGLERNSAFYEHWKLLSVHDPLQELWR